MILPTKHISEDQTLIGIGAVLLRELRSAQTVTSLWEKIRRHQSIGTYERFILALDMLYIIGALSVSDGLIMRNSQ